MQRNNWQLLQRHCWDWRHVMSTWTGSCFDFPFVWTRCEFRLALNKFKMLWTISYNQKFSVLNYNFYIDICSQERSTTLYRICFFFISKISVLFISNTSVLFISKISDLFLSKIRVFFYYQKFVLFFVLFFVSVLILFSAQLGFVCLDVANGYSEVFVQFVKKVRHNFPTHTIMVGNCFYMNRIK